MKGADASIKAVTTAVRRRASHGMEANVCPVGLNEPAHQHLLPDCIATFPAEASPKLLSALFVGELGFFSYFYAPVEVPFPVSANPPILQITKRTQFRPA